ncbi:hypothetical protein DRH27_00355 [Candidatus Falkowbacteria bacterium]|nr:MAG: hypothetical protein DRH27_00355 [Candidatus Falkowbacteria bacterium]
MPVKKAIKINIEDEESKKNVSTKKKKTVARKISVKSKSKPGAKKRPAPLKKKKFDDSVDKKFTEEKKPGKIVKPKVKIKIEEEKDLGVIRDKLKNDLKTEKEILAGKKTKGGLNDVSVAGIAQIEKNIKPEKNIGKTEDKIIPKSDAVKEAIAQSQFKERQEVENEFTDTKIKASRSLKMYKRIAASFIALALLLVLVILYFYLVKVTIVLIPNQERTSNNMIFDIYDEETSKEEGGANAIKGIVRQVEIENEADYQASGSEIIGKEAIGKATIVNNYNKNQPLVATTRLLTPDNKLFRTKNTVNVPAGGSIEVEIYADEPSSDMAIEPTKLTVPGLWAGLQDKIYAETKEKIVYQEKIKRHIVESDIEDSARDLKQQLLAKAKAEVNETYKEYSQILYKIDENSIESRIDGAIGEEVDEFTALMSADVIVVAFDDKTAGNLAKQKFVSALSDNKELISFDEENIIYALNNYDFQAGTANINATFEGKVSLKEDSNIIEIDKILGLKKDQLDTYLMSLPEIAGFEVEFYPSFYKKVPKLVDRIKIEIKK